MRRFSTIVCVALLAVAVSSAWAATINVGPTRTYTTVQAGINAASPGDTVLVDSGLYQGPAGTMLFNGISNITVKGNGPTRPILDQNGQQYSVWGKGVCTVTTASSNITFDGLEFINGAVRTGDNGMNGSGIRWDGGGTCRVNNCSFHDNQEGLLITTTQGADIIIENSVIHDNGAPMGTGGSKHNIYAGGGGEGGINSFTLRYSWVYNATYTHDVKVAAKTIKILYNRIGDEIIDAPSATWGGGNGNAIDMQHGGLAYVIGNMITKGAGSSDGNVLRYGEEGLWYTGYSTTCYILYNTFNGERNIGQNNFITIASLANFACVANNIFYESNPADVLFVGSSPIDGSFSDFNFASWLSGAPHFWGGLVEIGNANVAPMTNFTLDYHLVSATASAQAVGQAILPGTGGLPLTGPADGFSLKPIKNFPNSPAGNPTLVGQNRSNYLDYGAYALTNVSTINQAPIVTAGPSLPPIGATWAAYNHVLPQTGALLMGTATDDGLPSGTLTLTWSKVSGPGTVTFASPNALLTSANFSAPGTYVLQLQASDSVLTGSATCTVYVENITANAGTDQTIAVGATANLVGTSAYTGPATRTYAWGVVSAPAATTVTFGTGTALSTTVSGFTVAGDYVLSLTVSDGVLSVSSTVKVTAGQTNNPPTVDAGKDVDRAYETTNVTLLAVASDPDGDTLSYAWTQTAGKAVTYVGGTNAASLTFTIPTVNTVAEASMTFQVTVDDGKGGVKSDSVNVRARIMGDANLDDAADVVDLLTLVYTFGLSTGNAGFDPTADFNSDGTVDVVDLLDLVYSFGRSLS